MAKEEITIGSYIVSDIREIEIKETVSVLRVSLYWLRESGFKGKVQVIDGLFDDRSKVIFEVSV